MSDISISIIDKPKCFKCHQTTHFARDCPTSQPETSTENTPKPSNSAQPNDEAVTPDTGSKYKTPVQSKNIDTIVTGCSIARGVYQEMKRKGVEQRTQSGALIEDVPILLKREKINKDQIKTIIIQAGTKNIVMNGERHDHAVVKYESVVMGIHAEYPNVQVVASSIPPIHPFEKNTQAKINKFNAKLENTCKQHTDFLVFANNDGMLLSNHGKSSQNDFKQDDTQGIHLSPHGYSKVVQSIENYVQRTKRKDRGSEGASPSFEPENKKLLYSDVAEEKEND